MAQRGSFPFSLATLGFAAFCAGCGGSVRGDDNPSTTDTGVPDVPIASSGWRSYTMKITSATRTWSYGSPSPTPGDPTAGWTARVDAAVEAGGSARLVLLPKWETGTSAVAHAGATTTFNGTSEGPLLRIAGSAAYANLQDSYDTIVVQWSSDGRPTSATLSGRTFASSGDVGWDGKVVATATFEDDGVQPEWRWTPVASFAPVALPWDERRTESSEPYEESLGVDAFAGSELASSVTFTKATSDAHGETRDRGATIVLRDWDRVTEMSPHLPPMHDFAGNPSLDVGIDPIAPAVVPSHGTSLWGPDDGHPIGFEWGATNLVEADCAGCAPELVFGPFDASYCHVGSAAGVATRLLGSGAFVMKVRAHAKPPAGEPTYPGPPPVPASFLHVQLVTPGEKPSELDLSAIAWPTTPASDGSYDLDWTYVTGATSSSGKETGVAVSAGGVGATATCSYGLPMPPPWSVVVTLETMSIGEALPD